jgi:hypothetical protein
VAEVLADEPEDVWLLRGGSWMKPAESEKDKEQTHHGRRIGRSGFRLHSPLLPTHVNPERLARILHETMDFSVTCERRLWEALQR